MVIVAPTTAAPAKTEKTATQTAKESLKPSRLKLLPTQSMGIVRAPQKTYKPVSLLML